MFDGLLAYSSAGAEEFRALGFPPDRVFTAFNAVTAPPPVGQQPSREEARGATVLFVGRLQARKRVDLLIQACAQVNGEVHLWVVGDGPDRKALESLASQVYPKTRFLGAQSGDSLTSLYQQADLFVLPGTGGLAVQEAMAYSLPVIVAEGDGTQRDLVQSGNGWLLPPDDLSALTEALGEALADLPRLRRMGEVSRRLVAERFNIDAMTASFVEALRTVTGGDPR
jgi:glycosyltransferase involved in cell wall biosynthesis